MRHFLIVLVTLFFLSGCDAVFHRYIAISPGVTNVVDLESLIIDFADANGYECESFFLPNGDPAFDCGRGGIVEITTDGRGGYSVRVSDQTAFGEPLLYREFYLGLNEKLKSEHGASNVELTSD
ncbi:hypothetical protein ACMXYV_08310 [Neptuniibacter sp. SY11_33]|uniref:hypothetical protein n=1 Tax=Neptuniibacter sp. SY11_33 TaxID=3398215 RepID=UPI0039F510A2